MRKSFFSASCALAVLLGLPLATPAVAQSQPPTTTVRGTLRTVITVAHIVGEPSEDPPIFFLLTPKGKEDKDRKNYVIYAFSKRLGDTKVDQATNGQECLFVIRPRTPQPYYRIEDIDCKR
jgi:hypothetical protein